MGDAIDRLADLVWFMAPAYAANMAAPFARFWPGWNRPLHEAHFGSHKTVAGFGLGVVAALAASGLQSAMGGTAHRIALPWWLAGLGFGLGAMGGDALKSLFKRRRGVPPGQPWIPFDQLDFVVGALLLVGPFTMLSLGDVATLALLSFAGDIAVNRVSYRLGIKRSPW